MTETVIVSYLVVGAVAGLLAGIFGIGGGLIIVPVLITMFYWQGMHPDVLTHMAVATSLATIVITSLSSAYSHHKQGVVLWPVAAVLSIGILFGAITGVNIASTTPGPLLQHLIGGFALLIAVQLLFNVNIKAQSYVDALPGRWSLGFGGGVIGGISAIFGIGGGTLTVPYLTWHRVSVHQAVATSAACGIPIALVGSLTNIFIGWDDVNLPKYSVGYVYWPAFCGIVLTSSVFARLGAKLAHRLPATLLRRLFAVLLIAVGIRFVFFTT